MPTAPRSSAVSDQIGIQPGGSRIGEHQRHSPTGDASDIAERGFPGAERVVLSRLAKTSAATPIGGKMVPVRITPQLKTDGCADRSDPSSLMIGVIEQLTSSGVQSVAGSLVGDPLVNNGDVEPIHRLLRSTTLPTGG
jgi:hypothetical protein